MLTRVAARIAPWTRFGPLDGVRGLALMCVVWTHLYYTGWALGYMALETFFAMSGFLITRNLIVRQALGAFYLGRLQRLAPAVVALIALLLLVRHLIPVVSRPPSVVWVLALFDLTGWFTFLGYGDTGLLGHLWSLSVEECFYAAWPLVLLPLLGRSRRHVAGLLGVAGGVDYLLGALLYSGHGKTQMLGPLYFGPPLRIGGILWGAALAIWCSGEAKQGYTWRRRVASIPGLPVLLLVSAALADGGRGFGRHSFAVCLPLVAMATLLVVLRATNPHARRGLTLRLLDCPLLRILGVASYSLYLWHLPAIHMTAHLRDRTAGSLYLAIVCCCLLVPGSISFLLLERPYLLRAHQAKTVRSAKPR